MLSLWYLYCFLVVSLPHSHLPERDDDGRYHGRVFSVMGNANASENPHRYAKEDLVQKRRLGHFAAGWLLAASIWVSPALADMFYYRDAQGQLHLTNVWSRIPSAYRDQAARNRRPEKGGPTPVADKSAVIPSTPVSQPRHGVQIGQRAATASPHAKPVNARAFGLLSLRMSDFEVLRRLGPPAAISDVGERALASTGSSKRVIRITDSNQSWYYPGTARTPATRLEFQGGVLVNKTRLQR